MRHWLWIEPIIEMLDNDDLTLWIGRESKNIRTERKVKRHPEVWRMLAVESISVNLDFSPSLHMSLSLVMDCTPFLSLVLTSPRSLPLSPVFTSSLKLYALALWLCTVATNPVWRQQNRVRTLRLPSSPSSDGAHLVHLRQLAHALHIPL